MKQNNFYLIGDVDIHNINEYQDLYTKCKTYC